MNLLTPHQSKALDFKSHISLTANAGSGKTFVLAKRYMEIAVNEKIPLRNIAAITFTDKAAGELYQKIAKEIEFRISCAKDESEIEELETIRRQLVSANISTIHSFCIDILHEHPVEAGIDANFTPIDEILADELIELSVEEVIKKSLENSSDEEKIKYLIRFFSSKSILSKELINSVKQRRNLLILYENLYKLSEKDISNYFFHTFLNTAENILSNSIPPFIQALFRINSTVLEAFPTNQIALDVKNVITKIDESEDFKTTLVLLSTLKDKILVKAGTIAKKGYLSSELSSTLTTEIKNVEKFLGSLINFEIPVNRSELELELAKFGKIFLYFFNHVLELYTVKKNELGYLDYEDILIITQNILSIEDVRKSISEKFKYIMIDEYQDTNELQYKIFLPILDNLKTGNLFVVGDEKQSIYMFRDAELEIFNMTKNEILKIAGKENLKILPDSFRMAPNICLFINTLFRKLFENPNPLFNEVEHSDIVCARDDGYAGNIELLLAEHDEHESEEVSEADLVSERILALKHDKHQKEEVDWGDVAVLCRKRKSFIELEKSFLRRKIPYAIIGGKGFYQRQSVYDIYNYFSFLLDQNNDTALVGILRSPFFSISDTEIFEIGLVHGSSLWQKLINYGASNSNILHVTSSLNENISLINKADISFILRKIMSETGYLALLASKSNADQEDANIRKLVNLSIKFFADGFRSLYDYVNFLKDAIETVEDESQAVVSDEVNSVKIMTIHQSKGLEFPIVFLYRCGEASRKSYAKSKSVLVHKEYGLLTKVPLHNNYFGEYQAAPIVGLNDFIGDRKNSAEIKRLFYVAISRAKNQLFLSSSLDAALSPKKDSFISLFHEGLNSAFLAESISIKSRLKLLSKNDEKYISHEKDLELIIPIIKKQKSVSREAIKGDKVYQIKSFLTDQIVDNPHGEIISATKLSVFMQCPLKYKLIYQLGFSNLMDKNRIWIERRNDKGNTTQYDFNPFEDNNVLDEESSSGNGFDYSKVKGTIIHRLLSENIDAKNCLDKVEAYLKDSIKKEDWNTEPFIALKNDISRNLITYFDSISYEWIKGFSNFKNEFEIYHQHEDFFLFGITDKLIITEDKIIIVDYKTDNILVEEIQERAKQYFLQLEFYAYITSEIYKNILVFELRIIFIQQPDEVVSIQLKRKDLNKIIENIELVVKNIRGQSFEKNLGHCKFCKFSIDNTCFVT